MVKMDRTQKQDGGQDGEKDGEDGHDTKAGQRVERTEGQQH